MKTKEKAKTHTKKAQQQRIQFVRERRNICILFYLKNYSVQFSTREFRLTLWVCFCKICVWLFRINNILFAFLLMIFFCVRSLLLAAIVATLWWWRCMWWLSYVLAWQCGTLIVYPQCIFRFQRHTNIRIYLCTYDVILTCTWNVALAIVAHTSNSSYFWTWSKASLVLVTITYYIWFTNEQHSNNTP